MSAIGQSVQELDTPALVVDLDAIERNIGKTAALLREAGVSWRPHTKGQKVPEIAKMEIAAGAIGITCAKLGEAEVMVDHGIDHIWLFKGLGGPGALSDDALAVCEDRGLDVVAGACPLMFLEPVGGFHRLHRAARKARHHLIDVR